MQHEIDRLKEKQDRHDKQIEKMNDTLQKAVENNIILTNLQKKVEDELEQKDEVRREIKQIAEFQHTVRGGLRVVHYVYGTISALLFASFTHLYNHTDKLRIECVENKAFKQQVEVQIDGLEKRVDRIKK